MGDIMDTNSMINMLYSKDNSKAYNELKKLEELSINSNELYSYIDEFIKMVHNEKCVIRVRGFRLFCKQAKWDKTNIINKNIEDVLVILNDDKPTAVRQALAALKDVVIYKKELRDIIKEKVLKIDYLRYNESMHSLIFKDMENLISLIDKEK